ncbi:MAG: chaperonin GroEL [Myxococcales bacterium]|nr:chaperonin GroEL [Myxococcales bacterium]
MAAKQVLYDQHARARMASGLDALANAVKVTLGPRGRNVLIEKPWGAPIITKDGVTVAREIELEDRCANIGAQMVKDVASATSDASGDGTTTATVLAQAIYVEGAKMVAAGANPMELKRGIEAAVTAVVVQLEKTSRPLRGRKEVAQVGTIAANGDSVIGELLAEAMEKVGPQGVVTLEQAKSIETTVEFAEGVRFDRGYLSAYFITDAERMEAVLHDAYVLIYDEKLSSMQDLLPLLEQVSESGKPLLVIAEDVDKDALATLVVNKLRGNLDVCAIKAPGFGAFRTEMLEDVAAVAGGQAYTKALGVKLDSLTLDGLGRFKKITVEAGQTTLISGAGKKADIDRRVKQLKAQIELAASDADRDRLKERLAKLAGGVAIIHVGAASEAAMKEKMARTEDAHDATRAAVEEGVVPGGGVALLRTLPALRKLRLEGDQQLGVRIVARALEEPLRQMAENGGEQGAVIVAHVLKGQGAYGYNVAKRAYEDLFDAGVLDPAKVVRVALQKAASVASLMLTTEALIAEASPEAKGFRTPPAGVVS